MISDFKNRFAKVNKHISKWARRQNIQCYRIYDWDIPGHPLVVDRYGAYLHLAEYRTHHNLTDEEYQSWWSACIEAIISVTGTPFEHIFIKQRQRMNHKDSQYEKLAQKSKWIVVNEHNLNFKVNLTDYVDTGLFLDHRILRQRVMQESQNKHVLNIFAYTGAFSVYAAKGGAKSVTQVDLSNTYTQWAKDNFALNNLNIDSPHLFIVSDVMQFLKEDTRKYDLIIADPPSFSNSKKMKGTWDIQRDHNAMLSLLSRKMKHGAKIYFSNNLRGFQPDFTNLPFKQIQEITNQTIPEDFRNKRIHKSYSLEW